MADSGGKRIEGKVVEADSFGNLVTDITAAMLADCPPGTGVTIECDTHETMGIQASYEDQPPMTLIAVVGDSGNLELAIVDDSAKIMLGVPMGASVTVRW